MLDNLYKPSNNDDVIKVLRANFKEFVHRKYPHITYIDACGWAFYPLRYNIGIDFWDIFLSEENLRKCRKLLFENAKNKKTVKNPKSDADSYFRSISWLKEYFDERFHGVENYLKTIQPIVK